MPNNYDENTKYAPKSVLFGVVMSEQPIEFFPPIFQQIGDYNCTSHIG